MVIFMINLNSWCASSWLLTSLRPLTLFGNPIFLASPFSFFMATFQTFAIFVSFPIHLVFLALSLDNFSFYFTAKIKAMDWTLLQLWGGCIAQQLIALALDLNLEFIKVYFMVSIFSSLTSCVRIRANYFCVSQFSHLKMETTGLLRIKWVTTSNMLKTIPGT